MTDTSHIDRILEPEREPDLEAEPAPDDDPIAQNVDRILEDSDGDATTAAPDETGTGGAEALAESGPGGADLALAPPPPTVPLHALHREREKHRETRRALADTPSSKANMEQAFERLLASPEPLQGPEPASDAASQSQPGDERLETRLAAHEGVARSPDLRLDRGRDALAHQVLGEATFRESYHDAVNHFRDAVPDYMEAAAYLTENVNAMLEADGHSPTMRTQILAELERMVAQEALREGVNPGQRFYEIAKSQGYGAMAMGKAAPAEGPPMDTLKRGQEASASLGNAPGTHVNETSLEHLASLDGEEFDQAWEKMRQAGRLG